MAGRVIAGGAGGVAKKVGGCGELEAADVLLPWLFDFSRDRNCRAASRNAFWSPFDWYASCIDVASWLSPLMYGMNAIKTSCEATMETYV